MKCPEFYNVGDYDVLLAFWHLCMGVLQMHGLIIFRWESQLAPCVLRPYASASLKILSCVSDTCDHTQKQMQSEAWNSMNMIIEFQECLDHLTVCMFI